MIGLFATAVFGAIVAALVRIIHAHSAGRSEVSPPSIPPQAPTSPRHLAEVDIEACESPTVTEEGPSSAEQSKKELDQERWNRSTPSGRFERALCIFSDASEEPETPSVIQRKRVPIYTNEQYWRKVGEVYAGKKKVY